MKISVVIPAYNCKDLIAKCLDSILSQTGAELEVIVVNDGSTDATGAVLEAYGSQIQVITTENGGVAAARNTGLDAASGDFVMFVDADDRLREGCLRKLLRGQMQTGADIVRFSYICTYLDGSEHLPDDSFQQEMLVEKPAFRTEIYPHFIRGIRLNSVWGCLFKRSVVEGLRFRTDMWTAEDAVFSLHAYTRAERVLILPFVGYEYHQTGNGITGGMHNLFRRYVCNFMLAGETLRHLPAWGMNTPSWYVRTCLRPVVLTFDKLRRIRRQK